MKRVWSVLGVLVVFVLVLVGQGTALAGPEPYLRVSERDHGNIVELDVAVRAFEPTSGDGPRIVLVGAAHVGDAAFYRRLQYLLNAHDLVLYEGVGLGDPEAPLPEVDGDVLAARTLHRARLLAAAAVGHRTRNGSYPSSMDELLGAMDPGTASLVRPLVEGTDGAALKYVTSEVGGRVESFEIVGSDGARVGPADLARPVGGALPGSTGEDGIQRVLARTLRVEFQLDAMDYTQAHWLNCDVTMEQFQGLLEDAGLSGEGDSFLQMMAGGGFLGALQGPILGMLSNNTTLRETVKLMLIDMLGQAESLMAHMPGPMGKLMDVLLHDRNDVVVARLRELAQGADGYESIGVFYGAAHLDGLERALVEDLGYEPVATHWLTAMGVDMRRSGINPDEARMMRSMITRMMEQEMGRMGAGQGAGGGTRQAPSGSR